ncbi:iron ABC transporter permease [Streptomyces sp. ODS28]|uniref:FecCD family ABC transporter permease n=1 Tax=Streptomyces sp. ODS28 TaxID=3136688 RepID=UPI0031EAD257
MPVAPPTHPAAPGAPSRNGPAGGGRSRRAATARRTALLCAAAAALVLAALLSLAVGARAIAPGEVAHVLLHGGGSGGTGSHQSGAQSDAAEVISTLRLPRTLVGLLVGAALGVAGAVMQGLTRNPIAEPGVLGVAQGASVGVLCAITFAGVHGLAGSVWFAFAGAGIAGVVVYAIAARGRGGATPVKLALAGAAVNALLLSVVSAILTTRAAALDEFRFWQVGSLSGRDAAIAGQLWPFLVAGLLLVLASARGLDALALGEDAAKGLGQNVAAVRVVGGLGATVLTGAGVAAAGPIAFVGLAVPHIARALVGGGHRWLLPMSTLLGPVVLLVSDVVGRILVPPGEVPAGVMTALLGVPFLVALVRRRVVAA